MAHNLSILQSEHETLARDRTVLLKRVLVGSALGVAWGASLRGWMAWLAVELGDPPRFTWFGTFGGILLPIAVVGALLGAASYDAERSVRTRWRWAILSPLLLPVAAAAVTENFFAMLITTGMGGGAIGVALIGILGGYALSGFGASWLRWISGALTALFAVATVYPFFASGSASGAIPSASKAYGALLFVLLMALLVVGVSAPARYHVRQPTAG
jgi:hypothetical protein